MASEENNNEDESVEDGVVSDKPVVARTSDDIYLSTSDRSEVPLYPAALLRRLTFDDARARFDPPVTGPSSPGPGLEVRPLSSGDYNRGFVELLGQLTEVGHVDEADFLRKFSRMKSLKDTYYVTVIVDKNLDKIVGAATLVKEEKFIHGCGVRGVVEDVVVSDQYRGKQLGKVLVATLIELGKSIGCYKISLNCNDDLVKFYAGFGLVREPNNANFLQIRIMSD